MLLVATLICLITLDVLAVIREPWRPVLVQAERMIYSAYPLEALEMGRTAIRIAEQEFTEPHVDLAEAWQKMGELYFIYASRGSQEPAHSEAALCFEKALRIQESCSGPLNKSVRDILGQLADVYMNQCRYARAERMLKRMYSISQALYGTDHPDTLVILNRQIRLYRMQERHMKADRLTQELQRMEAATKPPHVPEWLVH